MMEFYKQLLQQVSTFCILELVKVKAINMHWYHIENPQQDLDDIFLLYPLPCGGPGGSPWKE